MILTEKWSVGNRPSGKVLSSFFKSRTKWGARARQSGPVSCSPPVGRGLLRPCRMPRWLTSRLSQSGRLEEPAACLSLLRGMAAANAAAGAQSQQRFYFRTRILAAFATTASATTAATSGRLLVVFHIGINQDADRFKPCRSTGAIHGSGRRRLVSPTPATRT